MDILQGKNSQGKFLYVQYLSFHDHKIDFKVRISSPLQLISFNREETPRIHFKFFFTKLFIARCPYVNSLDRYIKFRLILEKQIKIHICKQLQYDQHKIFNTYHLYFMSIVPKTKKHFT